MDSFYNAHEAEVQRLATITSARMGKTSASDILSTADIFNAPSVQLISFPQSKSWRLCNEGGDGQAEEAIFRVQGILCGKDLPPVPARAATSALRARRFIRQNVKITGLGEAQFLSALTSLEAAYLKIANNFPDGTLEDYQPATHNSHYAIEANTRYFTFTKPGMGADEHLDFLEGVDPDGTLARLSSDGYSHTEDNRVDYFQVICDAQGNDKYQRISPSIFRVGDIVEAAISFVCLPTKTGKHKTHLALRALVLLSQEDRNNAAMLRMRNRYKDDLSETPVPVLKRKAAYADVVDADSTTRHLGRMRID
ncbi:hypothetical protein BKA70DRAFT_1444401 [Coprinopsis sp. MPI-PUGE-AT-0042]|nr:hypothetical protein BKA70DRAFT_1444401 [Coprinopsis sp. MPI-PUGE-AT-0042]